MQTLFHLHPSPDKVMTLLLQRQYQTLSAIATSSSNHSMAAICQLSRFLFLLGQTSINLLVFTEFIAASAKKLSNDANKSKRGGAAMKQSPSNTSNDSDEIEDKAQSAATEAAATMEEEMGMAAAADADHERVKSIIFSFLYRIFLCSFLLFEPSI